MATLKDEDDLVPSGAETVDLPEEKEEPVAEVVEDARLSQEDGDDRDVDASDDPEEARKKRETAKERRERARKAKERDKEELALLRATVAKQDRSINDVQRALIENQITFLTEKAATARNLVDQWNTVTIKATGAKEYSDAQLASQYKDQAAQQAREIENQIAQLQRQAGQPQQRQQQAPAFTGMAQEFLREIPWYNVNGGDEDSLIVQALDKALTAKGVDPHTPAYWAQLKKNVKARLPHKFSSAQDDGDEDLDDDLEEERPAPVKTRKGPPTGGSSRTTSSGSAKEIRLPKEMVEAMKEAGHWDDPVKRAKVAKRYQDGLRNNSRG